MGIIEDELNAHTVFKDLRTLDFDYIPADLPHRDDHLRRLSQLFRPLLTGSSQNALIRGPVGTGKTALAKLFSHSLASIARQQGKHIEYIHINCRKRSTDSLVLIAILTHFDPRFPDRGFSVQEMLQILRTNLQRRDAQLLLILDEADALLKKSGPNLIYSFTRFTDETQSPSTPVSLILISQHDILEQMDEATLSTFRHNVLLCDKYTRDELHDIVHQRVGLAFNPHCVREESLDLIADIASEWGDARFAIEILWKAGIAADEQRSEQVIPEHVRAAKAETYSVVTETKLKNLERHQLLALLSIAKRLQKDGTAYAITGEVEKTYAVTCEEYNEQPRAHTTFWTYLKEIELAGFITLKLSGKGQLGSTQLISLPDIPAEALRAKLEGLLTPPL
jgi:archaeal cell division control protein 6